MLATILVFVGSVASAGLVWDTADMLQGLIVCVNMPAIFILGGIAYKCLDDYSAQIKEGKEPVFKAKNIDLPHKTDFWN